jgi:hypothetical protein
VEKHSYNSATFEAVRKGKVYKILVQAMGIFGFSFLGIGFCKMIMEIYRKRELIG